MITQISEEGATLFPVSPDWFIDYVRRAIREELRNAIDTLREEPTLDLLTANQTVKLLDVTRKTLRDWEKQGVLCPMRIARRTYYRQSDIQKALLKGTQQQEVDKEQRRRVKLISPV